ncbi:MAG TPA: DUF1501 domain-containing protein [Phycisphaerae bacterium]|nr:DUF1501 domain-containing protein [Phycisphaerae bacterium]
MSVHDSQSCSEYLQLSRRQFLAASGGTALALGMPAWLPSVAYAEDDCSDRDVIVTVFLRGAADGLTLCVPHADDLYYTARPTLNIPRPDASGTFRAVDLDGFFGLPPQLAPLLPAYQNGDLLLVHACGSTDPTRSHFDAQRYMEIGKPGDVGLFTGWLGRHLATSPPFVENSLLRAIGIGYGLQRALESGPQTISIPDLDTHTLSGSMATVAARRTVISAMHALQGDALSAAATTAQQTIDLLGTIDFAGYVPEDGASYGTDGLSLALKSTAALIKAEVGVEAVAIDVGGWDNHVNQGVVIGGAMSNNMTRLATGLAAFHADLFSGLRRNVTLVVMSEFGRRLLQNGSLGTDHGHGNVMFLMGPGVDGGRVLANWPGLDETELFEGRDLAVTTDFRDVLAEIVSLRLGNPSLDVVFPGYTPTFRGVTRSCEPGGGDLNCDGILTYEDSGAMAQLLTDREAFEVAHPDCPESEADLNADGQINGLDIQEFVRRVAP